jgi:Flp pilus assembly pilin Flp
MAKKILDEKGQGLTEYLMLLFLISIVSIATTRSLGSLIQRKLKEAKNHVEKELVLEK